MNQPDAQLDDIDDPSLLVSPALESPAPFLIKKGVLQLVEAPDASQRELTRQILTGEYARPFVIDDGRTRTLHFTLTHVQSAMRIKKPLALELAYTRKMMAFLSFVPDPKEILIIGLGGGSLAKYCYYQLPRAQITSVEISADVIAFRELFEIPPDGPRMRIVHADALDYVAGATGLSDVVLFDGYDHQGITPGFKTRTFCLNLRQRLTTDGVLVANLSGDATECQAHLMLIQDCFENQVVTMPVPGKKNKIVFAFNSNHFLPRLKTPGNARLN